MAKVFFLASWTVEHFKGQPARIERVVAFLGNQNPDVLALNEVEGKANFLFLGGLNIRMMGPTKKARVPSAMSL